MKRISTATSARDLFAARLVDYADNTDVPEAELVIPEDLSALSDEELAALHDLAVELFDSTYGDGTGLSDDEFTALAGLTEGIEAILAETSTREAAATERTEAAADLAARVRGEDPDAETTDETPEAPADEVVVEAPVEVPIAAAVDSVVASARTGPIRVNMSGVRSRQAAPAVPASQARRMEDVVLAGGDLTGFSAGQGMNWDDLGKAVDRRLASFNSQAYESAHTAGRAMREQHSLALFRKPIPEDLIVQSNDPAHIDDVIQRAMDESRLPGGSLVAAGGWCAPSETLYDLCELESRDGLLSVPEIGIARGGINFTTGPDFADFYGNGFGPYTEAEDEAGTYAGAVGARTVGSKPCYEVTCPAFTEKRLEALGLCITSGLLAQRGYPEMLARTVRGSLVAHDHTISAYSITQMVAGSTAVTMTAAQVGAIAPLLDSIEKQTEHYRYTHRMSRSTTLEAVFPFWVRGVVRSDLARRQGVDADLISVTDSQIDAWFSQRGISAQYVYDWQPLTGAAGSFTAWPATVQFLLYSAGTWVRGTADVITMDTIYDSTNLSNNEFTALFTEEGMLMAKLCVDSRVVTVALCPTGETGGGLNIACDGTYQAAA